MSKTTVKWLIGITSAIFLMLVAALYTIQQAQASRNRLPVLKDLPEFTFTANSGQPFTKEDMLGKVSVVMFGFTSCKGPCPIMSGNYAEMYKLYDHSDKFQLVWVTVDPDVDSLDRLNEYAANYGVTDNRWIFLRNDMDATVALCQDGFNLPAVNLPGTHSTRFVLVDDRARIRGYYSGTDGTSIEQLKADIRELVRNMPT
jgi:protein SCO1/2